MWEISQNTLSSLLLTTLPYKSLNIINILDIKVYINFYRLYSFYFSIVLHFIYIYLSICLFIFIYLFIKLQLLKIFINYFNNFMSHQSFNDIVFQFFKFWVLVHHSVNWNASCSNICKINITFQIKHIWIIIPLFSCMNKC